MEPSQLLQIIRSIEGEVQPGSIGMARAFLGAQREPARARERTVLVLGHRVTGPSRVPFPDPGMLTQLHRVPDLGGLAVFLDCQEGSLEWHWTMEPANGTSNQELAERLPLMDLLGSGLGADMICTAKRRGGVGHHQGCMLGAPVPLGFQGLTEEDQGQEPPGIDALIAAIPDATWTFAVLAFPVPPDRMDQRQQLHRRQLHLVRNLREQDDTHPLWEEGEQALQRSASFLAERRPTGLWKVYALFLADSPAILERGLVALGTAFPSNPAAPMPVRTHRCHERAGGQAAIHDPGDQWLGSAELARILDAPRRDWPGFRIVDDVVFDLQIDPPGERHWTLGTAMIQGAPRGPEVMLNLDRLTRHTLVAGITGSGKSNTVLHLLLSAWRAARVPFLVIEPVKSEYRRLLNHMTLADDGLHVFTPGHEARGHGLPLRLNPMAIPPGTPPGAWVDGLIALFQAAFVLYPPMPYVLKTALHRVYSEAGWDLVGGLGSGATPPTPTLEDLMLACDRIVDNLGYDQRIASDVRASLRARLGSLLEGVRAVVYGAGSQTPDQLLFEQPCVIELDALPRVEDKAFAMGLLVLRLNCWRRFAEGQGPHKPLRHVLVLEEAHRLLRKVGSSGQGGEGEGGNPRAQGVEQITDLLSEVRSYGQGVIIADQIPSRLAEDAVKNTDLKILHRLVADDERELVGGTTAMDEAQRAHLVTLLPGQAILFQEPMDRPVQVAVKLVEGYDRDIPDLAAIAASMLPDLSEAAPPPYRACRSCPRWGHTCGEVLARAQKEASRGPVERRARAAAVEAANGLSLPPFPTDLAESKELALCIAATASDRAARWIGVQIGLDADQVAELAKAVALGGHLAIDPDRSRGPMPGCASCLDPCRWRRVGERLAFEPERWLGSMVSRDRVQGLLHPSWKVVRAWAPLAHDAALAPVVFCAVVHELDQGVSLDRAAKAHAPIASLLAEYLERT